MVSGGLISPMHRDNRLRYFERPTLALKAKFNKTWMLLLLLFSFKRNVSFFVVRML